MTQPTGYNPNVPERPSDSFATSQPSLQLNFQSLFNVFLLNHISINDATNAGNHSIVQLLEQLNPIQTDVGEIAIYTKDAPDQTDQIFIRYQGNGQEYQFTNYQIYSINPTPSQTTYFTFLPGRLLVYFGVYNSALNVPLKIYPPVAKNIVTVDLCPTQITSNTYQYRPTVFLTPAQNGFINEILVSFGIPFSAGTFNYLVIANI